MAEHTCFNCVYCICDPLQWLRWLDEGETIVPQCGNHPQWPGELHEVPGIPCQWYEPRPAAPRGKNVRLIRLSGGGYAYVDAADYEELNRYHWRLENGYAARYEKGKVIFMHRQILRPPKGKLVDHTDGGKTNNCRANLRPATRTQNRGNQRKRYHVAARFKGIFYSRAARKWYAHCMYAGRTHCSAYFATDEEAARAYDALAVAWFGEFARLNFPREWPPERRAQVYAENRKPRLEAEKQGKGKKAKVKRKKGKGRDAEMRAGAGHKRRTRSPRTRASSTGP